MHDNNISMALSTRYQRLANEVLRRLPSGWQANRVLRIEESRETLHLTQGRPAVACVAKLQFKSEDAWIITLYTSSLDNLSDEAVRWILAREFGRVLSEDSQPWEQKSDRTPTQEKAEMLAIEWGFSQERQRFEEEYLLPKAS